MEIDSSNNSGKSHLDILIKSFVFDHGETASDVGPRDEIVSEITRLQEKEVREGSRGMPVYSLSNIIVQSEYCLLSDNEAYRTRGMQLVARLLHKMGENLSLGMDSFALSPQSLNLLVVFVCKRLKDYHSLVPCLDALFAIVTHYEQSLDPNNGDLLGIAQAIFAEINVQRYSQAIRQKVFELLLHMFSISNITMHLETHAVQIVDSTIGAVEGEKDPRCLLRGLRLILTVTSLFGRYLNRDNAERAFNAVACYFPITFKPSANDTFGITYELLTSSLIDTLVSNSYIFFNFSLPYFLNQLRSDDASDQGDGGKENEKYESKFQAFWALRIAVKKYSHGFLRETERNLELMTSQVSSGGGGGGGSGRSVFAPIMAVSASMYAEDDSETQRGINLLMEIRDMIFDVIFTSPASLSDIEDYLNLDVLSLNPSESSSASILSPTTLGQVLLLLAAVTESIYTAIGAQISSSLSASIGGSLDHSHNNEDNVAKSLDEIDRDTFVSPLIKRVKEEIALNITTDSLHVKKTIVTLVTIAKSGRNNVENNDLIIKTIFPLLLQYFKSLWKLTGAASIQTSLRYNKSNLNIVFSSLLLPIPPSLTEDPNFDSDSNDCCKSDSGDMKKSGGGCCGGGGGGGKQGGGKVGGSSSSNSAKHSDEHDHSHAGHSHDHGGGGGGGCCGGSGGKSGLFSPITRVDSIVIDIIENLLYGFTQDKVLQVSAKSERILRDLTAATISAISYPFYNGKSLVDRCADLTRGGGEAMTEGEEDAVVEGGANPVDADSLSLPITIRSIHVSLFKLLSRILKIPISGLISSLDFSSIFDSAVMFSLYGDHYAIYATIASVNSINKSNYKFPAFSEKCAASNVGDEIIESSVALLENTVMLAVNCSQIKSKTDYFQVIMQAYDSLVSLVNQQQGSSICVFDDNASTRCLRCLYQIANCDEDAKPGFKGFVLLSKFLNIANDMLTSHASSSSRYSRKLVESLLSLIISLFNDSKAANHNQKFINYFLSTGHFIAWIDSNLSHPSLVGGLVSFESIPLEYSILLQTVIKNSASSGGFRDEFIGEVVLNLLNRLNASSLSAAGGAQKSSSLKSLIFETASSLLAYVEKANVIWSPKNKLIDSLIKTSLDHIGSYVASCRNRGDAAILPSGAKLCFESAIGLLSSIMFKLNSSDSRFFLIYYQVEVLFVNVLETSSTKMTSESATLEYIELVVQMFLCIVKPLLLRSDIQNNANGEVILENLGAASAQLELTLARYTRRGSSSNTGSKPAACLQETVIKNIASILNHGSARTPYRTLLNENFHFTPHEGSSTMSYAAVAIAKQFTILSRISQPDSLGGDDHHSRGSKATFITSSAGNLSPFWKQKLWLRFSEILLVDPKKSCDATDLCDGKAAEDFANSDAGLTNVLSSTISSIWSHFTSFSQNEIIENNIASGQSELLVCSPPVAYSESVLMVLVSLLSDLSLPLLQSSTVPLSEIALVAFKALEISTNKEIKTLRLFDSKASSFSVMAVNCIANLIVIDPALLIPYVSSIIPILVDMTSDYSGKGGYGVVGSWLRHSCLSCICLFAARSDLSDNSKGVIPYSVLFPHKKKVVKGLMPVLNDKKRAVRMLAAKARNMWTTMK